VAKLGDGTECTNCSNSCGTDDGRGKMVGVRVKCKMISFWGHHFSDRFLLVDPILMFWKEK
jgi:hypothetical protein